MLTTLRKTECGKSSDFASGSASMGSSFIAGGATISRIVPVGFDADAATAAFGKKIQTG